MVHAVEVQDAQEGDAMTTDPMVTVVFFGVALIVFCGAAAAWETYRDWQRADAERRAERLRQRDRWALIERIEAYTHMPQVPDTVPAEWEQAA